MTITPYQVDEVFDFIDEDVTVDWLCLHTEVSFDDRTHTMTIKIDNINEESYKILKEQVKEPK